MEVDTTMGMARTIAAVFGAVYIVAGLAGFILETPLFGLFDFLQVGADAAVVLVFGLLGFPLGFPVAPAISAAPATAAC